MAQYLKELQVVLRRDGHGQKPKTPRGRELVCMDTEGRNIFKNVLRTVVIAVLLGAVFAASLLAQTPLNQTEIPQTPMPGSTQQNRPIFTVEPLVPPSQPAVDTDPRIPSLALASTIGERSASQAEGKQPKRILWVIPNYRAVSANVQLPPLTAEGKFWLATQDSFDYSSFIVTGVVAGISQARNDTPEFQHGAAAYGRYYWHTFVDQTVGNYFTEAILPTVAHQDPRYYTLGRENGGFVHRAGYAMTRLIITRTDSGGSAFNLSEIVGNAVGAGISDLYYPPPERTLSKTGQKWSLQLGLDALFNVAKEFWPDINHDIFRDRYGSR